MTDRTVTLAHGAGTERTRELLADLVVDRFGDAPADPAGVGLAALDDGAVLPTDDGAVVITTDSHVVDPPSFPGGDVGRLAACGTINDLAAMGATDPLGLSSAVVVEAGTPVDRVDAYLDSMAAVCDRVGCPVRTGDTKVVRDGEVDEVVVTTTGVARIERGAHLPAAGLSPGDRLVVSGPVGDHGVALLAAREDFEFASPLTSDVAPVAHLVAAAREVGRVTAATDPTRGGFATAVNELADAADLGLVVEERAVPVADATAGAAEVLGIDPLTVACEGRIVLGVAPEDAERVRDRLRDEPGGADARIVGRAVADHPGEVVLDTGVGERYLPVPTGETLPRIC
ncbi:hydrogenase expression/formation protein HypE [Halorientalis regularis]|uniref:Hydrogenase expression/formation protein HypE n=1 Tax=Halorientalis regularis TaxID=660518 RepID=A0A1G7MR64_9EURY|nr:hydrogenase expression/formation protein HypE [Halorientalis regularis]SDF64275.1 hydrogenase expression/formation protein HypE [Halorientalis regularis]